MTIDEEKARANIDDVIQQERLEKIKEEILEKNQKCPLCGSVMEVDGGDVLVCQNCGYREGE